MFVWVINQFDYCTERGVLRRLSSSPQSDSFWLVRESPSKENGSNAYPLPLKNLLLNSTQCKRSACKKAERDSMSMSTPIVANAQTAKPTTMAMACQTKPRK